MSVSKTAWILALIGGILGIIGVLCLSPDYRFFTREYGENYSFLDVIMYILSFNIIILYYFIGGLIMSISGLSYAPYTVLFYFALISSILIIIGSFLMMKEKTAKIGSLFVLIFGALALNVLAIIGGIIGTIKAFKKKS